MSPARSKRQTPVPHQRSRNEIVKAVAVGAGVVLATALLVWLMRPGPPGIPGTGGLINRQPRSSWLVGTALAVGGLATWLILRNPRTRPRAKILIPVALGVVLLATVVVGFVWPGGLLRHDVAPAPPPPEPTTTTNPATPTTTPGTTKGSAPTTTEATTATTTPAATATTTKPANATTTASP